MIWNMKRKLFFGCEIGKRNEEGKFPRISTTNGVEVVEEQSEEKKS
jgi:hypothetical protein